MTPGLNPKEKRIFFPGCLAATLLFLAGSGMTYFFILPLSLAFTIDFSFNVLGLEIYRPEAGNYYSAVIWMTFAVGLAFQFPLVLILLIRIGVLTVKKLRSSRRFVLVILMVSAALITPGGDPVSLCILTIPLYFLFEISILVGILIERKKASSGPEGKSGIAGSILLLISLLILGGTGAWLYLNWDKAESFFLNLPPSPSTAPPLPQLPREDLTGSPFGKNDFILELSPIHPSAENNQSIIPSGGTFRARLRP